MTGRNQRPPQSQPGSKAAARREEETIPRRAKVKSSLPSPAPFFLFIFNKISNMSELAALKSTVEKQGSVIDALAHRLGVAEDTLAIQALHNTYGYCTPLFLAPPCLLTTEEEYSADLDKCLYLQVVDLFEDDGEVRFHGAVFKGKAGVKRLFVDRFGGRFVGGKNGPITVRVSLHLLPSPLPQC